MLLHCKHNGTTLILRSNACHRMNIWKRKRQYFFRRKMWAGLANNDSWCFFILKYGWSLEAEGLQSKPLHLSKRILYLVDSPPGILRGFTISGVFWLFGAFHPFSRFSRVTGEEEVAGKRQTAKWENPDFCQMEKFTSRFLASSLPLILKTFQILLLLSVTEN